ncbi:MAG: hypothetical protein KDJ39_07840 [Gammaproteobacteria bacterium]|nr:hypothetical protein [Gammaproteobacteria bacterium]MCP5298757.1 hypothetical protein [Chromatiaceae bacterium]
MRQLKPHRFVLIAAAAGQPVAAAPADGEFGSHAAAVLVVLGLGALLMGMRNLRELRYKRPVRPRPRREPVDEAD